MADDGIQHIKPFTPSGVKKITADEFKTAQKIEKDDGSIFYLMEEDDGETFTKFSAKKFEALSEIFGFDPTTNKEVTTKKVNNGDATDIAPVVKQPTAEPAKVEAAPAAEVKPAAQAETTADAAPVAETKPAAQAETTADAAPVAETKPAAQAETVADAAPAAQAETTSILGQLVDDLEGKTGTAPAAEATTAAPAETVADAAPATEAKPAEQTEAKPAADAAPKAEAKKADFDAKLYYATPLNNLNVTLDEASQKTFNSYIATVAEMLNAKKEDGSLDIDTIKKMTLKDIENVRVATLKKSKAENISEEEKTQSSLASIALKDFRDFILANKDNLTVNGTIPQEQPEEEGFWSSLGSGTLKTLDTIADVTFLKDMANAIKMDNRRTELHYKHNGILAGLASTVGQTASQIPDVASEAIEQVTKWGAKVTDMADNVQNENGKGIAQGFAGVIKAADGVLNLAGSATDGLSYLLKGGKFTNDTINEASEITLQVLASNVSDLTEKNLIDKQNIYALTDRLGVSPEDLDKMSSDDIRAKLQQANNIPPELILAIANEAAAHNLIAANGKLLVTQGAEAEHKLTQGTQQLREGIAEVAGLAPAIVDTVSDGVETVIGLVPGVGDEAANFVDGATGTVTGLFKGLTNWFDGKDGTTKGAFKQAGRGLGKIFTLGIGFKDEPKVENKAKVAEPVKTTSSEEVRQQAIKENNAKLLAQFQESFDEHQDKLMRLVAPPAMIAAAANEIATATFEEDFNKAAENLKVANEANDASAIDKAQYEYNTAYLLANADTINAEDRAKIENDMAESLQLVEKDTSVEDLAARIHAEIDNAREASVINIRNQMNATLAAQLKNSLSAFEAKRLAMRAENEAEFGKGTDSMWTWNAFWNGIDDALEQDTANGDRGFLKNLESVGRGMLLAIPKAVLKDSTTIANQAMGAIPIAIEYNFAQLLGGGADEHIASIKNLAQGNYNTAQKDAAYGQLGYALIKDLYAWWKHEHAKEVKAQRRPDPKPDPDPKTPCDIHGEGGGIGSLVDDAPVPVEDII